MASWEQPQVQEALQHGFAGQHSAEEPAGVLGGSTRSFTLGDIAGLLAERRAAAHAFCIGLTMGHDQHCHQGD